MELTTEATTPTDALRRAVDLLEDVGLPADVGVHLTGAAQTIPVTVDLHPRSHGAHEHIWRRLILHDWEREFGRPRATVQVRGVQVVLHDVRGAAA